MTAMSYILFLDDVRDVPQWILDDEREHHVARSGHMFFMFLKEYGSPEHIAFDHDLGFGPDGYDVAKFFGRGVQNGTYTLSENFSFSVHSANPVGAENIRAYMIDIVKRFGVTQASEDQSPSSEPDARE